MAQIKRWHDYNDKLNILITHLERSPEEKRQLLSKTIIKLSRDKNIRVENVTMYVRQLRRRWYDYDETVCLAVEHLKEAPFEIQTWISETILFNMTKFDSFLRKIYTESEPEEEY